MKFDWFDAQNAEEFGKSLALTFLKKLPASTGKLNNKEIAQQLVVIDKMYDLIEQFKQANKLNIYKKAKLGNAFMNELIAAGHNTEFVHQVTNGILQKL